jgi:hypothetical protein
MSPSLSLNSVSLFANWRNPTRAVIGSWCVGESAIVAGSRLECPRVPLLPLRALLRDRNGLVPIVARRHLSPRDQPHAAGPVDSQNACHFPAGGPGVMLRVSCRVICILSQTRVISAAAASGVPSECSACRCAGRPARTASRHVAATEVGGALAPKLVGELLLSELLLVELICLNQVVRERFRLATHEYSSLSMI